MRAPSTRGDAVTATVAREHFQKFKQIRFGGLGAEKRALQPSGKLNKEGCWSWIREVFPAQRVPGGTVSVWGESFPQQVVTFVTFRALVTSQRGTWLTWAGWDFSSSPTTFLYWVTE